MRVRCSTYLYLSHAYYILQVFCCCLSLYKSLNTRRTWGPGGPCGPMLSNVNDGGATVVMNGDRLRPGLHMTDVSLVDCDVRPT